jgi:hypothetical protein
LTFDAPYDRVATELREFYPRTDGFLSGAEKPIRRGSRAREEERRRKEIWLSLEHLAVGGMNLRITHEEPSPERQSVIRLTAEGGKLSWKRQADITILRLSQTRTSVTVHCNYYLRSVIFGWSRRRDRRYERERLAEIGERLRRQ